MFTKDELEYIRIGLEMSIASTKRALNSSVLKPQFKVIHETDLRLLQQLTNKVHDLINNPNPKK